MAIKGERFPKRREVLIANADFWMGAVSSGLVKFENEQVRTVFEQDMVAYKDELTIKPCFGVVCV